VSRRPSFNWDEAGDLLSATSSERHLARRLTEERQARGWSQERLAREVTAVGVPLPQSAVSKIEKPAPGGRRAITVQEAVAFSVVFDMPLLELLLPANARAQVQVHRAFTEGPTRFLSKQAATDDYWSGVRTVASQCRLDGEWRKRVEEELTLTLSAAAPDLAESAAQASFYTDVLAEAQVMVEHAQTKASQ